MLLVAIMSLHYGNFPNIVLPYLILLQKFNLENRRSQNVLKLVLLLLPSFIYKFTNTTPVQCTKRIFGL